MKDVVKLKTPITYLDEGIFGKLEQMRDLYSHFDSDIEWDRVKEAHKKENASNGEIMADGPVEVNFYILFPLRKFTLILYSIIYFL